jgi:hypothetical protein
MKNDQERRESEGALVLWIRHGVKRVGAILFIIGVVAVPLGLFVGHFDPATVSTDPRTGERGIWYWVPGSPQTTPLLREPGAATKILLLCGFAGVVVGLGLIILAEASIKVLLVVGAAILLLLSVIIASVVFL